MKANFPFRFVPLGLMRGLLSAFLMALLAWHAPSGVLPSAHAKTVVLFGDADGIEKCEYDDDDEEVCEDPVSPRTNSVVNTISITHIDVKPHFFWGYDNHFYLTVGAINGGIFSFDNWDRFQTRYQGWDSAVGPFPNLGGHFMPNISAPPLIFAATGATVTVPAKSDTTLNIMVKSAIGYYGVGLWAGGTCAQAESDYENSCPSTGKNPISELNVEPDLHLIGVGQGNAFMPLNLAAFATQKGKVSLKNIEMAGVMIGAADGGVVQIEGKVLSSFTASFSENYLGGVIFNTKANNPFFKGTKPTGGYDNLLQAAASEGVINLDLKEGSQLVLGRVIYDDRLTRVIRTAENRTSNYTEYPTEVLAPGVSVSSGAASPVPEMDTNSQVTNLQMEGTHLVLFSGLPAMLSNEHFSPTDEISQNSYYSKLSEEEKRLYARTGVNSKLMQKEGFLPAQVHFWKEGFVQEGNGTEVTGSVQDMLNVIGAYALADTPESEQVQRYALFKGRRLTVQGDYVARGENHIVMGVSLAQDLANQLIIEGQVRGKTLLDVLSVGNPSAQVASKPHRLLLVEVKGQNTAHGIISGEAADQQAIQNDAVLSTDPGGDAFALATPFVVGGVEYQLEYCRQQWFLSNQVHACKAPLPKLRITPEAHTLLGGVGASQTGLVSLTSSFSSLVAVPAVAGTSAAGTQSGAPERSTRMQLRLLNRVKDQNVDIVPTSTGKNTFHVLVDTGLGGWKDGSELKSSYWRYAVKAGLTFFNDTRLGAHVQAGVLMQLGQSKTSTTATVGGGNTLSSLNYGLGLFASAKWQQGQHSNYLNTALFVQQDHQHLDAGELGRQNVPQQTGSLWMEYGHGFTLNTAWAGTVTLSPVLDVLMQVVHTGEPDVQEVGVYAGHRNLKDQVQWASSAGFGLLASVDMPKTQDALWQPSAFVRLSYWRQLRALELAYEENTVRSDLANNRFMLSLGGHVKYEDRWVLMGQVDAQLGTQSFKDVGLTLGAAYQF